MIDRPLHLPLVFHTDYQMDIGPHVFPMDKYLATLNLLRDQGMASPEAIHTPRAASREQILLVHTAQFYDDFSELRWTQRTMFSELPISEPIVRGFELMAGGTILAARLAIDQGLAMHLGGGFHHAFADHAEGFCYINDIAVAIHVMRDEGRISRAAVIDVDLHQGNGTAHIFASDPDVFTFSIHQENLYPEKQQSDVDIGLDNFTGDAAYLAKLASVIPEKIAAHDPQLVVYVAGADPFEHDQLGQLRLTIEGLIQRDRLVAQACREHGWPMVTVLAGGYAVDQRDTARIHANTALELARVWGIEPHPC